MCISNSGSNQTRCSKSSKATEGRQLVNKRQLFSGTDAPKHNKKPLSSLLLRRYAAADQRQAAFIFNANSEAISIKGGDTSKLAGRGVCMCAWTQIAEVESKFKRVKRKEGGYKSFMTGAQMCGLRWVCPICTAKRANDDKNFVNDGLAAARKMTGIFPVMATQTLRHKKPEAATDVLADLLEVDQRMKNSKPWERLKTRLVGYARALEHTYGKNGHHPHYHTILLVRAESEDAAIKHVEDVRDAYMRQLARVGRDATSKAAWQRAFHVQGAAAAGAYIAKWGAAEELTGAQSKDESDGMTPWQLLRRSRAHEESKERKKAAGIWWEIIQATKGKAQLYKSKGFKEIVAKYRENIDIEPEAEPEEIMDFGVRDKGFDSTPRFQKARKRSLSLRESAEKIDDLNDARAAAEILLDIGETDNEILDAMGPDEIDVIEDFEVYPQNMPSP